MKVIKLILFLEINTLALQIVPCLADSLPYFCKDMDLCLAYNMEEGTMESIQIEYLNLINLMYASRNMEKFLEENAHAPDGSHRTQPILTRETMTYTLSFSISCVCLHANNNLLKGRASAAYERAMSDLECTSDDMWPTLLRHVLEYVTLLTNLELEGSAPSVPTLTRKEIIERDTTRKESRAAAIARAAAADSGDGGGDGGRGGSDAASGQGDEDEGSRGHPACRAAAKAAGGAAQGKAPQAGRKKK